MDVEANKAKSIGSDGKLMAVIHAIEGTEEFQGNGENFLAPDLKDLKSRLRRFRKVIEHWPVVVHFFVEQAFALPTWGRTASANGILGELLVTGQRPIRLLA